MKEDAFDKVEDILLPGLTAINSPAAGLLLFMAQQQQQQQQQSGQGSQSKDEKSTGGDPYFKTLQAASSVLSDKISQDARIEQATQLSEVLNCAKALYRRNWKRAF